MLMLSSPLSNCAMYLTMSHVLMILETEGQPAVSSSITSSSSSSSSSSNIVVVVVVI